MAAVYAITASGTNAVARPVLNRRRLGVYNQSTTATVYIAFDVAAVASATAGQVTLLPISGASKNFVEWDGDLVPAGALNMIASAGSTPVTVIEA
jgi:hypothetical protein